MNFFQVSIEILSFRNKNFQVTKRFILITKNFEKFARFIERNNEKMKNYFFENDFCNFWSNSMFTGSEKSQIVFKFWTKL